MERRRYNSECRRIYSALSTQRPNVSQHAPIKSYGRLCKLCKICPRKMSDFGALGVRPFRPFNKIEFSIDRPFEITPETLLLS